MKRKCFPPGKWAENNYFMDEKMYKLQDCPGTSNQNVQVMYLTLSFKSFRTAEVPPIKILTSCFLWKNFTIGPMCGCCFTWFHLYKVWTFNIAVTSPMSCHGMLQSTTIFNQWKLQFWQILFSWWDGKGMSLLFMHLRMLCSWRGLDLVAKVGTLLSELCPCCQVAFCSKIWKDQFYSINQHPW